jgi:hypothetical protein
VKTIKHFFLVIPLVLVFSCDLLYETRTFTTAGGAVDGDNVNNFPCALPIAGEVKEVISVQLINFTHDNAQNIKISLLSPGGKELILVNAAGGTNDYKGNYKFVDQNSDEGYNKFIIDAIAGVIVPETYWIEGDFYEFDNKDTLGNWTLRITEKGGVAGNLGEWKFTIQYDEY